VYDPDGISTTINSEGGGMGAKTGLYKVRGGLQKNAGVMENCSTALTEAMGKGGGHTPIVIHNTQTRNPNRPSLTRKCDCGSGKLYKKCCGSDGGSGHISKDDGTTYCLDTGNTQAVEIKVKSVAHRTRTYANQPAKIEERDDNVSNALNSATKDSMVKIKKINIIGNFKGEDGYKIYDTYNKKYRDDNICGTLTRETAGRADASQGFKVIAVNQSSIRRLTPKECERLQGFPDDWTSEGIIDGEIVKISDTQRYKQCGNAVTVDIVALVAEKLL